MLSLFPLALLLIIGLLVYKRRFTSKFKFAGMYFVQLYYLLIAPICIIILINIAMDILRRPSVLHPFVPDNLLFNLLLAASLIGGMGVAVHSTATTVFQSFKKEGELEKEAFVSNELFHGPFSHNMLYLGTIAIMILLALLELNHPYRGLMTVNFNLLMAIGMVFGVICTISILWSAHIGYSIIASFLGVILISYCFRTFAVNVSSYPITIISLTGLITTFSLLFLTFIIFAISETLSRRVVKRTFPKGHSFHENIDLKVLTIKIERDLAELTKRD